MRWSEVDRTTLAHVLPDAVVVLPVAATEQHGPALPTGTDTLIVGAVAARAVELAEAESGRPVVLAPVVPVGASDHHVPFGATLSLTVETMTQVVLDLARSVAAAGGRRLLIVNGHGGNRGPCHAAAQAAATRTGLRVGYVDYWELLLADPGDRANSDAPPIPGHAGAFEASLMAHLAPHLIVAVSPRDPPAVAPARPALVVHDAADWQSIDGYTDNPARGDAHRGAVWFDRCARRLADHITALAPTEDDAR